jgi:peptide/nickel transport system substrate-binding protein
MRLKVLAAVFIVVALGLPAVRSFAATDIARAASPSPSSSASPTTLRVGLLEDADNLSPFLGYQITSYLLWHLNYDFLVGFDAATLKPRPEIAESWAQSPDGKTWTFKVRHGITWQDGQPVTARDVAFTFNFITDGNLSNMQTYTDGIVHATALDDYTVAIQTKAPKANMLSMMVPIVPEHIWSKVGAKAAGTRYQNPPPIVGSGPFQVVEWKRGRYIRLRANPDYWKGAPHVDQLIFMIYTNPISLAEDVQSGTIDGAVDVPLALFRQVGATPGIAATEATSWKFTELGFNCYDSPDSRGNPVLLDQKFRHALNWAVDRQRISAVAFSGYAKPATSTIVPYSQYHWEPPADQRYAYDPAKANAELDAAGYVDVNGDGYRETKAGKKLSLRLYVTNDYPANQSTAKLVVGWFKDVGVKAVLSVVDAGTLLDAQYNYKGNTFAPDFDLFIWYWTQDPDPYFTITVPTTGQIGSWSDTSWTDPEYDRLAVEQARELDVAKRTEILKRMQQVISVGSPYVLFTYPSQLEAVNTDRWEGWVESPQDIPGYTGSRLYIYANIDTYVSVRPRVAVAATGSSLGPALVLAVIGVLVVGFAAMVWVRRSRRRRAVIDG